MWLLTTVAEQVSNALAFYLAMHNAGANESLRAFIDGMPKHESPIKFPWSQS